MWHSIDIFLAVSVFLCICSAAHRPECGKYCWCYTHPVSKSHQSMLHQHTAGVEMKVSNWKVLLGDALAKFDFCILRNEMDDGNSFTCWKYGCGQVFLALKGVIKIQSDLGKLEKCMEDQWCNLILMNSKPNLRKSWPISVVQYG